MDWYLVALWLLFKSNDGVYVWLVCLQVVEVNSGGFVGACLW